MNDGAISNCIAHCGRYECKMYGCQTIARNRPMAAMGCICSPKSEQTCQNPICPRKGVSMTIASESK